MKVGLTGKNCAGKTEIVKYLTDKSFVGLSLSDVVREELEERGLPETRENLIEVGTELRNNFGNGILAQKTADKLGNNRNYVIDSIRNPAEVEVLNQFSDFTLVEVTAEQETRYRRMKERNREGDPESFEQFQELEQQELNGEDESSQQLSEVSEMAEVSIPNNGSLDDLHEKINDLMQELIKEFSRPGWDEYFMNIAMVVASRSNCVKRKVAALIVKDRRIISTGYNGTPRNTKNCYEGGCPRCNSFADGGSRLDECLCSHGEENAITQAAYHGVNVKGGTIYSTCSPCLMCTKMIINSGLKEVVYNTAYSLSEEPLRLLNEAGIELRKIEV